MKNIARLFYGFFIQEWSYQQVPWDKDVSDETYFEAMMGPIKYDVIIISQFENNNKKAYYLVIQSSLFESENSQKISINPELPSSSAWNDALKRASKKLGISYKDPNWLLVSGNIP